ncbi:Mrx20p Ecym_2585 [Eremothecium cymbalariae DBVPG|uniref:Mitochondrial carrier protein n=1 Tax=Eremothecium cymbalariae (strain CBS 270.75 / DBVPG 7215 / KCTC 17166 / NRRL Y-17582) TaxID=931890 RepID=G8JQG7_ERECY|nr:Hypothetical protein Ecym_2585 [Eremothecium cymbalariae DBVPG\
MLKKEEDIVNKNALYGLDQGKPTSTLIIAGSVAAIFQTTLSYPFEFLKTGQQLHRSVPGAPKFNAFHPVKYYFSGCASLNVGVLFKTMVRFGTFEKACEMMKDPDMNETQISGIRLLAAGIITGFMESLWVVPFESVKTTMIENAHILSSKVQQVPSERVMDAKPTKRPVFHSPVGTVSSREMLLRHYEANPSSHFFSTVKEIYLTRGVRGFLQGAMPTVFRQLGNSVVRFTVYTWCKQFLSPHKPLDEYKAFAAGALSSCAVVAVTQPIDVIKTRMQSKYAWALYRSSLNCAYRIFVEEGVTKFWNGWAPRLFKVGLAGGMSFGVYQYVENLTLLIQSKRRSKIGPLE